MGRKEGATRDSTPAWVSAMVLAKKALNVAVEAAVKRSEGDVQNSNSLTEEALLTLRKRFVNFVLGLKGANIVTASRRLQESLAKRFMRIGMMKLLMHVNCFCLNFNSILIFNHLTPSFPGYMAKL